MKLFVIRLLVLLVLLVSTSFVASAQAPDPEHEKLAVERLEEISTELSLTADQKEKIRPVLIEEAPKLKALKDDTSLSRRKRFQRMRAIMEETNASLRPILTPDQIKKLQKMRDDAVRKRMLPR